MGSAWPISLQAREKFDSKDGSGSEASDNQKALKEQSLRTNIVQQGVRKPQMWEWTEVGCGGARGEVQRLQGEALRLAAACCAKVTETL